MYTQKRGKRKKAGGTEKSRRKKGKIIKGKVT
jgi:hypothetical protein